MLMCATSIVLQATYVSRYSSACHCLLRAVNSSSGRGEVHRRSVRCNSALSHLFEQSYLDV